MNSTFLTSTGAEEKTGSPTASHPPILAERPKKPTIIWKGQSLDSSEAANRMNRDFYQQKYEHEDTTIQRKYLTLWFDITAAQKDARADKELAMIILTRRNNYKTKVEVRGVMNAVIFGSWKIWAQNRMARREEWTRQQAHEKKEREEEKRREEARDKIQRMSDVKQRMSWKTGPRRSSISALMNGIDFKLPNGPETNPEGGITPRIDTENKSKLPKPAQAKNVNKSPDLGPFKPSPPTKVKPHRTAPSRRQTRLNVIASTPLSESMTKTVERLANPPNYVPAYMKRDSPTHQSGEFQLNFGMTGSGDGEFGVPSGNNQNNQYFILNEGDGSLGDIDDDSFNDTLTKMYYDHMGKVKANTAKKLRERAKARTPRTQPPTSPTNAEKKKSPEKIQQLRIKQKEVTERLYQGRGASSAGEDAGDSEGGEGKLRRRGTGRKLKKSVLVDALKKEKESMLQYLDRLIDSRGIK